MDSPRVQSRGYATQLINNLLDYGKKIGFTSFLLDTAKYMTAAQHIYRKAGFTEIDEYPEAETPSMLKGYVVYMEKKEL